MIAFAGPVYPLEDSAAVIAGMRRLLADAPDELNVSATWWTIPAAPGFPEELHGRAAIVAGATWIGGPADGGGPPAAAAGDRHADPRPLGDAALRRAAADLRSVLPGRRAAVLLEVDLPRAASTTRSCRRSPSTRRRGRPSARWSGSGGSAARSAGSAPPPPPPAPATRPTSSRSSPTGRTRPRPTPTSAGRATSSPPPSRSAPARPTSTSRALGDEPGFVRAAFGDTWDRLVEVKRRYDPGNLFRLNQNVDPGGG